MSRDEWQRLSITDDPRSSRHHRSKGPASTPATRLTELNSELLRVRRALGEACAEIERLESRLSRFVTLGGCSFGGVAVAQHWSEMVLWEALLNDHRFEAIFELGTWEGGFSLWLWSQTVVRKQRFYTYDSIAPQRWVPEFRRKDVFAEVKEIGAVMRLNEPCIVFCDNGNKPRELREYSAELRHPDSLLVVHDWGTEMQPEDVPDTVEMLYEDFCNDLGSISRVFKRK